MAVDALSLTLAAPQGWPGSEAASANNHSLDASTDAVGFAFQAERTEAIVGGFVRYGARTGTPPTYRMCLYAMDATTGAPTGSALATVDFTPPADATWNGTGRWLNFDVAYTPAARGEFLILVVEYASGTVDASNFSSFTRDFGAWTGASHNGFPRTMVCTAGSWVGNANYPIFGLRTASQRYGNVMTGAYTTRTASTVGLRQAIAFTMPAIATSHTLRGMAFNCSLLTSSSGKNPIFGLWSAGGAIATVTLDTEYFQAPNNRYVCRFVFDDATLNALTVGTKYYVGFEVADAANAGLNILGTQLSEADDLLAYPGGTSFHLATFDGSSWTDDQTVRPMAKFWLDEITVPAGGGGGGPLIGGRLIR